MVSRNVYGGTYRSSPPPRAYGLPFTWVDTSDLAQVEGGDAPRDEAGLSGDSHQSGHGHHRHRSRRRLAHDRGALVAVDNTFLTPYLQRPLELGADFVVHSTTKYLNGHSDSWAASWSPAPEHAEWFAFPEIGGRDPVAVRLCLTLRGTKTLAVRMPRHEENARASSPTSTPPQGEECLAGAADHPGHEVQKRQPPGFGAMISSTSAGAAANACSTRAGCSRSPRASAASRR